MSVTPVVQAITPVLAAHGFALSFRLGREPDRQIIKGILSHRDGHSEETEMSLPVDTAFANVGQLSGMAINGNVASLTARILGNTANATAEVNFVSSDVNDRVFSFFFAYMKNKG